MHPIRVALVRDDNATSLQPFAEAFFRTLVMNGKPAVENGPLYSEITLGQDPSSITTVASRLVTAAPSVVVLSAGEDHVESLVQATESHWPPSVPRPVYLVGEDTTGVLHTFLGASASRRHRVFSMSPVSMPTSTRRFFMRFDAAYPGEGNETVNPCQTYDGVYALAYAAFAAGRGEVTGPALARGLARLAVAGSHHVETGPSDLLGGIASLSRGDALDLNGASGALDFDPSTGELAVDYALLCPGVDEKGGASGDVESGVRFEAATGRSVGALRCP